MDSGYAAMLRTTRGDDIDAACGQLVGSVADRTKRQARYRARLETGEGNHRRAFASWLRKLRVRRGLGAGPEGGAGGAGAFLGGMWRKP